MLRNDLICKLLILLVLEAVSPRWIRTETLPDAPAPMDTPG